MATTIYVSKSGSDANNGSTYVLSKLTIQAGITAAGASGVVIVGSGIYNERLTSTATVTMYCDGVVILDGTGLGTNSNIHTLYSFTILPYSTGGSLTMQNFLGTNLIFTEYSISMTNVTLLSTSNAYGIFCSGYSLTNLYNCVFSGFTTYGIRGTGTSITSQVNLNNCTLYNCTTGLFFNTAGDTSPENINSCIFSNCTHAYNVNSIAVSNNNIFYGTTDWKVGATTYTSQATLQAAGYDLLSLWQNPNFVDPTNNVFYPTSNPNVTNNNYLYYGAYPYGLTRGTNYNPDSKWNLIAGGGYDNSGWYNPDGNITLVAGLFQLTSGTLGVLWSPVYDLGSSQTISQFGVEGIQVWSSNMFDKTITDVRPNYQTAEIRASASSFAQNDGVIAWVELKNKIPFTTQGSTNLTGRYVQLRISFVSNDVAA